MVIVYLGTGDPKLIDSIKKVGMEFHVVGDRELSKTMAELIQHPTTSKGNQPPFLYLYKEDASLLAKAFQQEHIFIGRVAENTEENIQWSLRDLMDEVDLAYEIDTLRTELYIMVQNIDTKRFQTDADYQHLMRHAIALVEDPHASLEQLDDMVRACQKA